MNTFAGLKSWIFLPLLMGVSALIITGLIQPVAGAMCPTTLELDVIALINQERGNAGLSPLSFDVRLTEAARLHSQDMATNNFFSHTGFNGSFFADRIEDAGYLQWMRLTENIAAGYPTPVAVVNGWMNSPGHRANILDAGVSEIGIGYAYSGSSTYGHYWTSDFGESLDGPAQGTCANSPPTGSVVVNSGAAYTTSDSVTLTISCSDADGCTEMRFSDDGIVWDAPLGYAGTAGFFAQRKIHSILFLIILTYFNWFF